MEVEDNNNDTRSPHHALATYLRRLLALLDSTSTADDMINHSIETPGDRRLRAAFSAW